MVIVCISASNIKHAGENSTSLKTCNLIKNMIQKNYCNDAKVEIINLAKYEIKPCIGCGACFKNDRCIHDNEFNKIYETLINADGLFIISAHYAPIPAKLSMLLEKIEELAFLKRFNNEDYRSPLYKKPVGIIGHGGGPKEFVDYYREPVLDSIWNALSYPVEMDVVSVDDKQKNGVIIPVERIEKSEKSIFPIQEYDWQDVEKRLKPLVYHLIKKL